MNRVARISESPSESEDEEVKRLRDNDLPDLVESFIKALKRSEKLKINQICKGRD